MLREFLFKSRAKSELIKAFRSAGLFKHYVSKGGNERTIYPQIHDIYLDKFDKSLRYTFTLLNGMDPKEIKKKEYVFKQHFGKSIEIEGDLKKFILTIHVKSLPKSVSYDFKEILQVIEQDNITFPIVAGKDIHNKLRLYDATNNPNLLIFGQPGSGKSSILHSILCTLLQLYSPNELQLYLADFKMSEFNLYEGVKHVKSVSYLPRELGPALSHLKTELTKRGQLLKDHAVRHINKLLEDKKPPYIVLCIDEFVMIKDDDIMADLLQIASLGRAYGIYLILSMQRPSHKILSTDVRGVLSVRMGFRTVDLRNAMIGETPGSEKISKDEPGKFLLNLDELTELKAPYLDEDKTEKVLANFKSEYWRNHSFKKIVDKNESNDNPMELSKRITEKDVFNDVN
ncbi:MULTISPECIES: FtsK/SpoIIIE domain-containing protein [unclassified Bacillus (in: firmicutes)]|uniref:FtsK/SpoIIIE domain-containing protein n=1 Tax=unclassified Bacillus (in: firmicutes) TaxID=185979 RepID=UPI001BE536CC|nr:MULTISPECIES: FtsK/SpoIIIE domain-containing protein [unclassified Bacillus (in: firmicutes)]MBT2615346.1 DNA translocase FtsK [Bacillus sp. ISL-78]MBT2628040.1 DNA translocase FtsK [Bacillus sp. ISL-101]